METTYHPKALTADQLNARSQDVKQALTELYGNRLERVILYGSYARGDFHAESDVDYMVILRDDVVKSSREIHLMAPVIGHLALMHNVEISVLPVSLIKYQSENKLVYQAVQREGICT